MGSIHHLVIHNQRIVHSMEQAEFLKVSHHLEDVLYVSLRFGDSMKLESGFCFVCLVVSLGKSFHRELVERRTELRYFLWSD